MKQVHPQGLQLDGVSVDYGSVSALNQIDLRVKEGESIGMVGLSGAGKTTLLRLFNGMVKPSQGRVQTLGSRLDSLTNRNLRRLRTRVGFIHQELHLVPNMSVLQNVLMGRLGHVSLARTVLLLTLPSQKTVEDVHQILDRVGIGEKLYMRVDRLSGGERQRVAIARALFQEPEILLADEPISSVDPARARSVLELLTQLARERGLTLCVSLHNVDLAREFFPRLIGMKAGRIVFDRKTPTLSDAELGALLEL